MSRLVSSLEAEGLVEREGEPGDRRVVRVRATPAGVRVLQEGRGRRVTSLAQRLRKLNPRELEVLEQAVGILEDALKDSD